MFKTEGWRLFVAWMAKEPKTRTVVAVARALGVSSPAVSNWKRAVARPDVQHRPMLRQLCGIDENAWMTAKERRARAATEQRIANGTTG
jgi:transcriptional regulator with XRE-family HTH domain